MSRRISMACFITFIDALANIKSIIINLFVKYLLLLVHLCRQSISLTKYRRFSQVCSERCKYLLCMLTKKKSICIFVYVCLCVYVCSYVFLSSMCALRIILAMIIICRRSPPSVITHLIANASIKNLSKLKIEPT